MMKERYQHGSPPRYGQRGLALQLGADSGRRAPATIEPAEIATAERVTQLIESARMLPASANEAAARDALEETARLGSVDAAFSAAILLLSGGRQDLARGLELLRLAAGQGLPAAALMLGKILWSTQGTHEEGVEWLRRAASTGEAGALYVLGLAYYRGQGVEKDLSAARELQLAAAMCGLPEAQFELSLLLAQGLGGDVDALGARRWEAKAAKAGHPRACLNRGARLANKRRPDFAKVARWYARAAAAGNAEAATRLFLMTEKQRAPGVLSLLDSRIAGATPVGEGAQKVKSSAKGNIAGQKKTAPGGRKKGA
jgi:TPR repeat protein